MNTQAMIVIYRRWITFLRLREKAGRSRKLNMVLRLI
jgi:hypothetical protein